MTEHDFSAPKHISESLGDSGVFNEFPKPTPEQRDQIDVNQELADIQAEIAEIESRQESGDATVADLRRLDDLKIDLRFYGSQIDNPPEV